MAKQNNPVTVDTTTPNMQASQIEEARKAYEKFVAQFGNEIAARVVPVEVATARVTLAQSENAAEIAAINADIKRIKAEIEPLNAQLKPLFIRLSQLTGKKQSGEKHKRNQTDCLECGQGRHTVTNPATATCKTYAAKMAARVEKKTQQADSPASN